MISVVIPLFNKGLYIRDTLLSVINQSYNNFEVIVIDDGSTDNSYNEAKKISDKRVRIIKKENGGESSARNRGIIEAKNKYIAFLDADDIWNKHFLENIIDLINLYPRCGIYTTNYVLSKNNKTKKAFKGKFYDKPIVIDNYFLTSIDKPLVTSNTAVISKDIFKKVGNFNETLRIGPDLEMWFRISLHYKVAYSPYVGAVYNLDAVNRVMNTHNKSNIGLINLMKQHSIEYSSNIFIKYYISEIAMRDLKFLIKFLNKMEISQIIDCYYSINSILWSKKLIKLVSISPILFIIFHKVQLKIFKIRYVQSNVIFRSFIKRKGNSKFN